MSDGQIGTPLLEGDAPELEVSLGSAGFVLLLHQQSVQLGDAAGSIHGTSALRDPYPTGRGEGTPLARHLLLNYIAHPPTLTLPALPSCTLPSPPESIMARSLTVKHDEKPATSSLLNLFLLVAFGCLALATIFGAAPAEGIEAGETAPAVSTDR
jgi:hypothetical protein